MLAVPHKEGNVSMQVQIRHGFDPQWLDDALHLYQEAGLGHKEAAHLRAALVHSYRVVTCWNGEELCGIGRLISDGVYYASIFDVAVHPAYQRQGIGHLPACRPAPNANQKFCTRRFYRLSESAGSLSSLVSSRGSSC